MSVSVAATSAARLDTPATCDASPPGRARCPRRLAIVTAESPRPVRRTNSMTVMTPGTGNWSSAISSLNQISVPVGGRTRRVRSASVLRFGVRRGERGTNVSACSEDHHRRSSLTPAGRPSGRSREVDGHAAPQLDGPQAPVPPLRLPG